VLIYARIINAEFRDKNLLIFAFSLTFVLSQLKCQELLHVFIFLHRFRKNVD